MKVETLYDSPIVYKRIIRAGNWLFQAGQWHWSPVVIRRTVAQREHYARGREAKKFARMAEEL